VGCSQVSGLDRFLVSPTGEVCAFGCGFFDTLHDLRHVHLVVMEAALLSNFRLLIGAK